MNSMIGLVIATVVLFVLFLSSLLLVHSHNLKRRAKEIEKENIALREQCTTGPTVFLSHAHEDSVFIERHIIPALKANGMGVWYSRESIETAEEWERSIMNGLESSDWFVVAISPNAVKSKSDWVWRETGWAFRNRKDKIIPVLIGPCNPDDVYAGLPDLQYADCIRDPKKGADELALLLAKKRADELALLLAKKAAVAGLLRGRATSYWKWSMSIVVLVLLAAVVVVVFDSAWFRPILSVLKNKLTQSKPNASSQEGDRTESSVGAGAPTGPKSVSRPNTAPVDTALPMVLVHAGKFLMGSPTSEHDRDPSELQHQVSVDAFWMDPTEVTNAAFQKFLVANPSWQKAQVMKSDLVDDEYLRDWKNTDYPSKQQGNYPVTEVSWYAAQAYCTWMKKRLPTEAEWEYAARAGTVTAYWWGDKWALAGAAGYPARGPDPVGKQAHRNPWNLYDMLGNVREWTSTVYKPYPYNASDGREDPRSGSARTLRGGSWGDYAEFLRSAARTQEAPNFTDGLVGFRCARTKE